MRKLFLLILLIMPAATLAQEAKGKEPISPKPPAVVKAEQPKLPIAITQEMMTAVDNANREVETAQLKKENLILRLRLLLKVPNEWGWDEVKRNFSPPVEPPAITPKDK